MRLFCTWGRQDNETQKAHRNPGYRTDRRHRPPACGSQSAPVTLKAAAPAATATHSLGPIGGNKPSLVKPTKSAPTVQTLLTFTGHGNESTPSFTTNGDFTASWVYSGNVDTSTGSTMPDNFSTNMNTAGQGQDINFNGPNDIQASGSGNQTISGDNGSHYFTVQANDASTWTIKVVSAP
jgi:hypothetical protein